LSIVVLHNETLLVEAMQAGNEVAFTTLYWHYSPQLYVNIFNITRDAVVTEEIVQELFTRIWQKRESKGLGENFAGYIYRIGQHLVHDYFRKVQRDHVLQERLRAIASEHYEHVEEMLQQQQSSGILQKAINQLSPQQKKVYELVKIDGYTYKNAAEIMGISALTVKEYLVAANKSIRNYIIGHAGNAISLLLLLSAFRYLK
jgi:RNA polymerase sigma factor (sigma-70 family)